MIRLQLFVKVAVSIIILSIALAYGSFAETGSHRLPYYDIAAEAYPGSGYKADSKNSDITDDGTMTLIGVMGDGEGATDNATPPSSNPYFYNFLDFESFYFCDFGTISDTFVVKDTNFSRVITITQLSGPGSISTQSGPSPVEVIYEYTPAGSGDFDIALMAKDSEGDSVIVTKSYTVDINGSPQITSSDTTVLLCSTQGYVTILVEASDPDGDPLTFRRVSCEGTLDSLTGSLKFWSKEPGIYCHTIMVSDGYCTDTAEICVTVGVNTSPSFDNPDQKFYICQPDSICFEIFAADPDAGDIIEIIQWSGPGVFSMTGALSGITCFLPDDVDSADYTFIYEATDKCLRGEYTKDDACPPNPRDTVIITVVKGETFSLNCPGDTSVFICGPDTICFDPGEIPPDAEISVSPPSAWYDAEAGKICFFTNCTVKKDLKVVVDTECGRDSCMFQVDVTMNSAPLVILAPDTTVKLCDLDEICLPVGISDIDDNLSEIIITPQGSYNETTGKICFTPETAGFNTIYVQAIDDCGVSDIDSIEVFVELNSAPVVELTPEASFFLCDLEEICLPVSISDPDDNLSSVTVSSPGYYNSESGMICFTPDDTGGVYKIEITAIDSCGHKNTALSMVTVNYNRPPLISMSDSTVFLCASAQTCIPVAVNDPDDNLETVNLIGTGTYSGGFICFTPEQAGEYDFVLEAVDECGAVFRDSITVTVEINSPPVVTGPENLDVFQCVFEEICFDIDANDFDGNLQTISANPGYYDSENGRVCFTPPGAGDYQIIITASDSCYASDEDTVVISVATGESANIICPENPIDMSVCSQTTICYPLEISPANTNVTASYGEYTDGQLCFLADTTGTYVIDVIADALCGSDTCQLTFNIEIGQTPVIICPDDTTIELCGPDQVCLPLEITLDEVSINIWPIGSYSDGEICFRADSSGHYVINVSAEAECGVDTCSFAVDITFNASPEITSGNGDYFECLPGQIISYYILAVDPEDDPITFSLISSDGTIDPETGILTFDADTAGTYCFDITAADMCGSDTATVCINIQLNTPPVVTSGPDTSLTTCTWEDEICIPVAVTDGDNNIVSITSNIGTYSNGFVCFTPESAGVYYIITTAYDACEAYDKDTTIVTIETGQPITLECPGNISEFICAADTLCYEIGGIPEDADVTVYPASAWYDHGSRTICFYTNCSVTKNLKIVAENECGKDSCQFTVNVTLNSRPLVIMNPDMNVSLCGPEQVCIPVGISDVDNNIVRIVVTPGTIYNAITGRICFTPTTPGRYAIVAMAIDRCGKTDYDSTVVYVEMNSAPDVVSAPDFDEFLCGLTEICFPVDISDADDNIESVTVSLDGNYDSATGRVCFMPTQAGNYNIITTAVDECGLTKADTTQVNVYLNSNPEVVLGDDTTVVICEWDPICIPVTITDIDNNLKSITAYGGQLTNGYVCLEDYEAGSHTIIVEAIDSCNAIDADTVVINVIENRSPSVTSAADFDVFQCVFNEICFGVVVVDPDVNIESISTNIGYYDSETGRVCFTPTTAGVYTIITTATDECYLSASDTTIVTVSTGEAAVIDCPAEPIYNFLCGPETVCYELGISPLNATVTPSYGTFADGQLCFEADTSGVYLIEITAEAECGSDVCQLTFDVEIGQPAQITCPEDTSVFLCGPEAVCLPIDIIPQDAEVSISPVGSFENGEICFMADTEGIYDLTIAAESECGADTCHLSIAVVFNHAPVVSAGPDTGVFQCNYEEVCIPVEIIDRDNALDSIVVSPMGYYDSEAEKVCFTPENVGSHCLIISAYDECQAVGRDTVCVTVTTGAVAVIDCPAEPITKHLCDPGQLCIPISISPSTAEVIATYGIYVDGELCMYVDTSGHYESMIIATEDCGADTCIIEVNVIIDQYAGIICPDLPVAVSLCSPGTVNLLLPITPSSASVSILPYGTYNFTTKTFSFMADTTGHYMFTIIAATPCNIDTCHVEADIVINEIPELTCPGDIDTLVCLAEVDEVCFNVGVVGAEAEVTVLPEGEYSGGMVCVPVSEAGLHEITIIASSNCGADTCELNLTIIQDDPPVLTVPEDVMIPWCDDDEGQICIDGIFAEDSGEGELTITQTCGPGEYFAVCDDSGYVCFTPDNMDTTYEFCFRASDGCSIDEKTFQVTVFPSAACSVCVEVAIETDSCFVVGSRVPVYVTIDTREEIGGFDLLIGYDASALIFMYASQGSAISEWEYFIYNIPSEDCGSGCPSGLVHLVGIADQNDGPYHPPSEQLSPDGILSQLLMRVVNDQNLGGQYLPIGFVWADCGDNSFSNTIGDILYVDSRIYGPFGSVIWDESDDIHFPESARLANTGAPDSCMVGDKTKPVRCVYLHNGGICVKHPEEIDDRGDVNLNGVAYEIADAVVFTNYFIHGLAAFVVNVDGQIAATDINADGYALSVADLVYLIRVIIGDATMIPKVSPHNLNIDLAVGDNHGSLSVEARSACAAGAGFLVFQYEGLVPEPPQLGDLADGMELAYSISDSEIRILIYSFEPSRTIKSGTGELLKLSYSGQGNITLVETSFASFHGEAMTSSNTLKLLPEDFMVSQNYPNPFNPITTIDLSLPVACHWDMTIYNVNGQLVRQFGGDSDPGVISITWDGTGSDGRTVASGIYLYKVTAGQFKTTRKMTMIK
nr:T9SS type A sorting domain-containing protein [candidate division Zixibacteria bacterium]